MRLTTAIVSIAICWALLAADAEAKSIGIKPEIEQKGSKYSNLGEVEDFPEYQVSETFDTISSDETTVEDKIQPLQETMASPPSTAAPKRVKRTLGFMSRLGSCILTFTSNPGCWSRLTRAQIQREERRQLEKQQQEEFRRNMEKEIYKNYMNSLQGTNGTDGDENSSTGNGNNGFQATVITANRPRQEVPTTTTTPRPMFPLLHKLGRGMSRLFPRLFGFLNPNRDSQNSYDDSSPSAYFRSFGTNSRNDIGSYYSN